MVMETVHRLRYIIKFDKPVDYFDVFLQKQIDTRIKFGGDENLVILFDFNYMSNDDRFRHLINNYFCIKAHNNLLWEGLEYIDHTYEPSNFVNMVKDSDKIKKYINKSYPTFHKYYKNLEFSDYEKHMNNALEQFQLFITNFEFNADEKKVLNAFLLDDKVKTNIKFVGWEDYWIQ